MRRYLKLASNRLVRDPDALYVHPYSVDLSIVPLPVRVGVSEGDAHGAHGSCLSLDEALSPEWAEHFVNAKGEWLLPYLERLHRGQAVEEFELIADYERRHGRSPRIFEAD